MAVQERTEHGPGARPQRAVPTLAEEASREAGATPARRPPAPGPERAPLEFHGRTRRHPRDEESKGMRYELLGRLRISDGSGHSFINTLKSEIVLAVLLIRADWVVK